MPFLERSKMTDLTKKVILASMGLVSITKKRAQQLAKDLIKEGNLAEKEEAEFIEEMVNKSKEIGSDINKKIDETVDKYLKKLDIATRKDLEDINRKLDTLIRENKS